MKGTSRQELVLVATEIQSIYNTVHSVVLFIESPSMPLLYKNYKTHYNQMGAHIAHLIGALHRLELEISLLLGCILHWFSAPRRINLSFRFRLYMSTSFRRISQRRSSTVICFLTLCIAITTEASKKSVEKITSAIQVLIYQ